jgi:uncharacterized protein
MKISFDPVKRATILETRGLDMADAAKVFYGPNVTFQDDRVDYGETRHITFGYLGGRIVFLAWTLRGDVYRIISMRKANEREQQLYGPNLGRRY